MLRADLRPPLSDAMEDALVAAARIESHHDVLLPAGLDGGLRHKLAWLARSVVAIDAIGGAAGMAAMPYETPNVRIHHVDFLTDWSRAVATNGRTFERIVLISPIDPGLQAQYIMTALQCLAPGGIMACTATQTGINGCRNLPPFTATHLYEDVGIVVFS